MTDTSDRIADLERQNTENQRQIAELKAQLPPPPPDDEAAKRWANEMHQMRERRASRDAMSHYTPAQLRAMEEACGDPQAIVRDQRNAPLGPGGIIPSTAQVGRVSSNAGLVGSNTGGWRDTTPLGPQPGINHVDRLMAHEDIEFRRQRIVEEAQRQALLKASK